MESPGAGKQRRAVRRGKLAVMGPDPRRESPDGVDATDAGGGWLSPGRPLLVGLLVLAMGLYFSVSTAQLERHHDFSERQAAVQRELSDFRARLEADIYASVALVRGLAVQVVLNEGLGGQAFDAAAAELLRGQPNILSLSLAPGFVVERRYPRAGNDAAIGLNLLEDEAHKQATLRAISLDAPVLAGPSGLARGGQALAVHFPLWVDRDGVPRLWGAVSLALDYERTLERAGIRRLEKDLDIAIVGRDASGPGGEPIRGVRPPPGARAVRTPVFLPGGSWLILATPKTGWHDERAWLSPGLLMRVTLSLLAALATIRILHDRQRIRRLAGMDPLTHLPNRRHALQHLARLIARGRRDGIGFALLSFDLDGFKPVNDTYGHAAGDKLLAEIGRRLVDSVRPGDMVARMGGDEFLVLVPTGRDTDEDWLRAVALRVQATIGRPMPIEGHWLVVGASIGIARFPRDGDESGALLRKADEAMYRAKQGRTHGIEFAGPVRPGPHEGPPPD